MSILVRTCIPLVAHICFVLASAHGDTVFARISALFQFDSYWFESITRNGYVNSGPMSFPLNKEEHNIAFYPGYSIAGYLISQMTRLAHWISLLLAAFLFTGGFWYYFARLSTLLRIPLIVFFLLALSFLSFPGTFFLTTAYAESMMLCFGMAFLCERIKDSPTNILKAGSIGFVAFFSHIRGVFFLLPATLLTLFHSREGKESHQNITHKSSYAFALSSLIALLAPACFYLYCWCNWGDPWIMEKTTQAGWYHRGADLLWPFQLSNYSLELQSSTPAWYAVNPLEFGRLLGTALTILIPLMLIWNILSYKVSSEHSPFGIETYLYASALLTHYGLLAAMATNPVHDSSPMYTYIRYGIMPWLILLLALGCDMTRTTGWRRWLRAAPALCTIVPFFVVQWYFIQRFTRGIWVS